MNEDFCFIVRRTMSFIILALGFVICVACLDYLLLWFVLISLGLLNLLIRCCIKMSNIVLLKTDGFTEIPTCCFAGFAFRRYSCICTEC